MKINNPRSRFQISIKNSDRVLEVGGGNNPHPRSNVVVDKYVDDNTHRADNLKVLKTQQFIQADGESLPFKDREFDYVICCHVLEHVPHPDLFIKEQTRVAPRGYLETPSLLGEYLAPKESHRWLIMDIDDKIILYEKERLGFKVSNDFGQLFLKYLPSNSLGFKLLLRTHPQIMTMNYQWKDNIDYLINPEDEHYLRFFTRPWEKDTANYLLKQRSMSGELKEAFTGTLAIMKDVFRHKVLKKQ
jgi:hypothetical protein